LHEDLIYRYATFLNSGWQAVDLLYMNEVVSSPALKEKRE
jgi:hypothetical protein